MEGSTNAKPNILLERQENQELRIYFFIGSKPVVFPPVKQDGPNNRVVYVIGFKLEEAFKTAQIKGLGFSLVFTGQSPTVREFLREMELESLVYEALKNKKPLQTTEKPIQIQTKIEVTPAQMNFENFRSGLLLFANEKGVIYKNPEDQEILKRIISGLSYAK